MVRARESGPDVQKSLTRVGRDLTRRLLSGCLQMEPLVCPPFEEATHPFQKFLLENGWPTETDRFPRQRLSLFGIVSCVILGPPFLTTIGPAVRASMVPRFEE